IKKLEPVGIGAQNTRECLLLQLYNRKNKGPDVKKAIQLLENYYQDLFHRNMEKIMNILSIDEDELKIILKLLASLNLTPITESESNPTVNNNILPDFILSVNENEEIEINLFRSRSSSLYINQSLMET